MITQEEPTDLTPSSTAKPKPRRWPYIVAALLCAALSAISFAHVADTPGAWDWSLRLACLAAITASLAVWPEIGVFALSKGRHYALLTWRVSNTTPQHISGVYHK